MSPGEDGGKFLRVPLIWDLKYEAEFNKQRKGEGFWVRVWLKSKEEKY